MRRYKMGRRGIRGLETRMRREKAASVQGVQIEQWSYSCWRGSRRESQCYGRKAVPRVRAAKSSEFGEGKLWAP